MSIHQLLYVPGPVGRSYLPQPPPYLADPVVKPYSTPVFGVAMERFRGGLDLWANFDLLPESDYLNTFAGPVMSRRMYEVLLGVGSFAHEVIPVRLHEHSKWKGRRTYVPWEGTAPPTKPGRVNTDFVAVVVPSLEVIDWSTTEYAHMGPFQRLVKSVMPLASGVIEPASGFPVMFEILGVSIDLSAGQEWVNGEARSALERAGIKVAFGESPEIRRQALAPSPRREKEAAAGAENTDGPAPAPESEDSPDEQVHVRLADINSVRLAKQTVELLRAMLGRLAPGAGVQLVDAGDAFLLDAVRDLARYAKTGKQCAAECLIAVDPMLAVYDTCGEFPFRPIGNPFQTPKGKARQAIDVDQWRAAWRTVLGAVSARQMIEDGGPVEIGDLVALSGVELSEIRKAVADGTLQLDETEKNESVTFDSALGWLLAIEVPGIE